MSKPTSHSSNHGGSHSGGHSGGTHSGGHSVSSQHSGHDGHNHGQQLGCGNGFVYGPQLGYLNYNGPDNSYESANCSDLGYYNPAAGAQSHGKPGAAGAGGSSGGGWFDGIIKQFYDPKEGFKLGGFGGALLGGILGMSFLGTGSWLGIAGMAVMTLAGAWGGNKISEFVSSSFSKTPAVPTAPARTPGASPQAAAGAEMHTGTINGVPTAQIMADAHRNAAISGGEEHKNIQAPAVVATAAPGSPQAPGIHK